MNIELLEKAKEYLQLINNCEKELEESKTAKRRISSTGIRKMYVCTVGEGDFSIPVCKEFVLKQIDYHISVLESRLAEYNKFINNL